MANIVEETVWRDNIYEVARADYIIGGTGGFITDKPRILLIEPNG